MLFNPPCLQPLRLRRAFRVGEFISLVQISHSCTKEETRPAGLFIGYWWWLGKLSYSIHKYQTREEPKTKTHTSVSTHAYTCKIHHCSTIKCDVRTSHTHTHLRIKVRKPLLLYTPDPPQNL